MSDTNAKVYYAKSGSSHQSSALAVAKEHRNPHSGAPQLQQTETSEPKPRFFHANDLKVKKTQSTSAKTVNSKMCVRSISTHSPISGSSRLPPSRSLRTQVSMIDIRDNNGDSGSISPTLRGTRVPIASLGLHHKESNDSLAMASSSTLGLMHVSQSRNFQPPSISAGSAIPLLSASSIDSGELNSSTSSFPSPVDKTCGSTSPIVEMEYRDEPGTPSLSPTSSSVNSIAGTTAIGQSSKISNYHNNNNTSKISNHNTLTEAHTKELRAERKIMDLEISNSSLLAINKYLEKRLRKKTRDLEYFSSFYQDGEEISDFASNRGNKHASSIQGDNMNVISSDSEEEEEGQDNNEEQENFVSRLSQYDDDGNLLTVDKADAIRRRTRAHIEFLESSQIVDNKLQLCIGMTKSLLNDAENSLKYTVESSQVRLGGRVVNQFDDMDDDIEEFSR